MTLDEIQNKINTLSNFLSLILNEIMRLECELKIIRQEKPTYSDTD